MDKNLIKYHIKRLHLTNKSVVPNFDFASLYDRVMPTLNPCGEILLPSGRALSTISLYGTGGGIEPIYESTYRRRGLVDPVTGCVDIPYEPLWDDDMMEYPF